MTYILGTLLVWFIVVAALGGVIGWTAHSVFRGTASLRPVAQVGISASEAITTTAMTTNAMTTNAMTPDAKTPDAKTAAVVPVRDLDIPGDLDELWNRSVVLEPAARQRDRLHRELDARRTAGTSPMAKPMQAGVSQEQYEALQAECAVLRNLVHRHEATLGVQQATIERLQRHLDSAPDNAPPEPDLVSGAAVLGHSVSLDDLTVVVGIDIEVAALCHAGGILTWWQLATTPIGTLLSMLDDSVLAPPMPDPSSWPTQARLLAQGNWRQFKNITQRL